MKEQLFDQQNLTIESFVAKEEYIRKENSQKCIVSEESCDGFFEILQGRLRKIENSDNPNPDDLLAELPDCKLVLKQIIRLGEYDPKLRCIKYYKQTPETIEIVKIHERFHAIHHLMPDKNGLTWEKFKDVSSFSLELLAQLFTYIHIIYYKPSLLVEFENLNRRQSFIYQSFKMFGHYGPDEAENLYWRIRNNVGSDPLLGALNQILTLFAVKTGKILVPNPIKKIVPTTALRQYYKALSTLSASTTTQHNALKDQLRGNNSAKLIQMYSESFDHIAKIYDNPNEAIFDSTNKGRKKSLTVTIPISINSDEDVISVFKNGGTPTIVSNPEYDFEYLQREISPLRTTNAIYENGKSANKSGTGGIDFIGWNLNNNIPILGEIKVNNDQNPFYALIQLLTYLSELSTPNQIDRINRFSLFDSQFLHSNSQFYLYIFSCRTKNQLGKYDKILPDTKTLAGRLVGGIPQIKDIVFLHMDPITKVITQE